MKRLSLLCVTATVLACSGGGGSSGGGSGSSGGGAGGGSGVTTFKVSGTALMHPLSSDAGSVSGLTVRVEEPLKVALNDPTGVFTTASLDDTGHYEAANLSSDNVSLGVGIGIFAGDGGLEADGGQPRVVRTATVIYDVALQGQKPSADVLNTKAFAVPRELHDALTKALSASTIGGLANGKSTLIEAGFLLGQVVDAQGAPVAGVTIETVPSGDAARIFYPKDDFSGVGTATSSKGTFVYVHDGSEMVRQFRFGVVGKTEYLKRNAGAKNNACLVVTVSPGK